MHTSFRYPTYTLRRQVLALTGKFRVYAPDSSLVLYSQQKMFSLKEDIRAYSDESLSQELLHIRARQILDFSAAYDVVDSLENQKVGALRRKGIRSILRDEWEVLDANERPLGILIEDNITRALLRRFLLGIFLPQDYDIRLQSTTGEGSQLADLRQKFKLFHYELNLDFSMDTVGRLDRRLGIAAGILLATIEGRQD